MMMGGGLAQGVEGWKLLVSLLVGTVALAAIAVTQGLIGQKTRSALLSITSGPLGLLGSRRFASPAILAMMLGWFALNVSVAGTALGRLIGVPDRVGMALVALGMLSVTWFGVNALSWSALAAGIATVLIAVEGIRIVVSERDLTLIGDGRALEPIGVVPSVALVLGYGAAFALRTPDFTHDLERPRQVIWCALAGLAAPLVLFGLVGAALQQSTGTWNLADVLRDLGSPTIAYLFVAIGFTGSVMSNLYSGALSLSDVAPRIGYRIGLCLVAVVGTALAALHFSRWMLPYLTTMALAGPPLAAICWIHTWGRRSPRGNLNWRAAGIASWAAGLVVGLGLNAAGVGVALPAGILAAAGAYLAATWLGYSPVNLGARRSAKAESPSTRSEEP